jgi:hypothetical protein
MAKYEPKTKLNDSDVEAFLSTIADDKRREDAFRVLDIMSECTREEAKMWGSSIIGFGSYHYVYASGQEGDWMAAGFSPRKTALTLYIMAGFPRFDELMKKLGKYRTGKSCLYIKKLEDVDVDVLKELITASYRHTVENNEGC